jgi:hypothetical protein
MNAQFPSVEFHSPHGISGTHSRALQIKSPDRLGALLSSYPLDRVVSSIGQCGTAIVNLFL